MQLLHWLVAMVMSLSVSSLAAMPTDAQKRSMRSNCRPIIAQLVHAEIEHCPHGMDDMGETTQGLTALACVLNNRSHKSMTSECLKAAEAVWAEVPSFFRPDLEQGKSEP